MLDRQRGRRECRYTTKDTGLAHTHKKNLEREVSERKGRWGVGGLSTLAVCAVTSSFCINELFDVQKAECTVLLHLKEDVIYLQKNKSAAPRLQHERRRAAPHR